MAKTFHLTVARVGESFFDGEAASVTVPGTEGVLTVLAGHEPFVSALRAGDIKITDREGKTHLLSIESGLVEVSGNQTTVIL